MKAIVRCHAMLFLMGFLATAVHAGKPAPSDLPSSATRTLAQPAKAQPCDNPAGASSQAAVEIRKLLECGGARKIKGLDFSCMLPDLKDKEIIFIGESPSHYISELKKTACQFACFLARHGLRAMAFEYYYGIHPFMEGVSLGTITNPEAAVMVPREIRNYNRRVPADRRLLVTAIDIEHVIHHSKSMTVRYLKYLATLSTSTQARRAITAQIPALLDLKERKPIHAYLDNLEGCFLRFQPTFNEAAWDEIEFSFELLHASIDYQLLQRGLSGIFLDVPEIRGNYFRKTIDRAYRKAKKRNGHLLCFVGGAHAPKTGWEKNRVGKWTEAEYFDRENPETRGKTASILFHGISYKGGPFLGRTADIDDVVYNMLADGEMLYVSLNRLKVLGGDDLSWCNFFKGNEPKYDGVLFFRGVSPPPAPPHRSGAIQPTRPKTTP